MFGKKEDVRPTGPNAMNTFGQGTVITGDISAEGDVRVDGKVIGHITSKFKVAIGPTGVVEGDILCQNAYIDGRVTGNIQVTELLTLSKSANITGDLQLKKLVVEEGAKFNGSCSMGMAIVRNETIAADEEKTAAKPKYGQVG